MGGIEYFNNLTELDLRNNTKLTLVFCNFNNLTSLNISRNPKIEILVCNVNQLSELDISHCPFLLDLVQNYKPEITDHDLFLQNVENIRDTPYFPSTLLIDKNVQLYTGIESVQ